MRAPAIGRNQVLNWDLMSGAAGGQTEGSLARSSYTAVLPYIPLYHNMLRL
jgi:hypothetical protein